MIAFEELSSVAHGHWKADGGVYNLHLSNILGRIAPEGDQWSVVTVYKGKVFYDKKGSPEECAVLAAEFLRTEMVPTGIDAEKIQQLKAVIDVEWEWQKSQQRAACSHGSVMIEAIFRDGSCRVNVYGDDGLELIGYDFDQYGDADVALRGAMAKAVTSLETSLKDLRDLADRK